jgi:hypothetical protein
VIIKNKQKSPSVGVFLDWFFFKVFKKVKLRYLSLVLFGCFVVLPSLIVSAVYIKAWISPGHLTQVHKDRVLHKIGLVTHVDRWVGSYFPSSVDIPKLLIDIKFKNYQKISNKREEAWSQGHLTTGPDDYVPAKIRYKDKTVKVNLRLKGDGLDHLGPDKWSLRIKVKGGEALFGMRKFSIQHPMTREYEREILFLKALEREGIMVLRYFFVNVSLNGKNIGMMALEEHASKELLESQGRRDAPIIKFEDSSFWQVANTATSYFFKNYQLSRVKLVGANLEKKHSSFQSNFKTAVGLLRGFVDGKLSASQVFDSVSTGRYLAVAKVWGAEHSMGTGNGRFYYNPLTARLEIIGHDGSVNISNPISYQEGALTERILEDKEIKSVYRETLRRLNKDFQVGSMLGWARDLQEKNMKILHREFFSLEELDLNKVRERTSLAIQFDKGVLREYPDYLKVNYLKGLEGRDALEIINVLPRPVVVTAIKAIDLLTGKAERVKLSVPLDPNFTIDKSRAGSNPQVKKVFLDKSYNLREYNIQVHSKIEGDQKNRVYDAALYYPSLDKIPVLDQSAEQVLSRFSFITQLNLDTLLIKKGRWNVDDWLFIPSGFKLVIPEGTVLRFHSSVGLVARGSVLINGTEDEPVILRGYGVGANNSSWQGVFVSNTREASVWSNVMVLDTAGISKDGWNVSAGVTFYQAEAVLEHVSFLRNSCEDALNIVRSKFRLDSVKIKNALSDGFDADFSEGFVSGGRFEGVGSVGGGDAIDVSGTTIDIVGTEFKDIQDKAVSVGENSTLVATKLLIESAGVGVASKDGSQVTLTDSVIKNSKKAIMMAYNKKKEYGPGTIFAKNIKAQNLPELALVQKGSRISIDGVDLAEKDIDVNNLYATTMRSGLR